MLREHTINFLQTVIVFLLLTNAVSMLVTAYAMQLARTASKDVQPLRAAARRIATMVGRGA
jgi:hypothetical protein